jgi:uncharacterized protein
MQTPEDIIRLLDLKPHPEGGFYRETYRSDVTIATDSSPRYSGPRCCGTVIYFMLTAGHFSMMHRVKSDEIFHFYMGDAVEMLKLYPDGKGEIVEIGTDLEKGMLPQVLVEKDVWQGFRLKEGGSYVLFGTTVCPGFDFQDFETAEREEILKQYPDFKEMILKLTNPL